MKYISLKNYEIYNEIPKDIECFNVDDMIADAVSILNKKGYTTLYSCSGHIKEEKVYKCEVDEKDFNLEEAIENDFKVIDKIGSTYILEGMPEGLTCYLKFSKEIILPNIPNKFILDNENILHAFIFFYIFEDDKKSEKDKIIVENEIRELNNILYLWALELPYLNL